MWSKTPCASSTCSFMVKDFFNKSNYFIRNTTGIDNDTLINLINAEECDERNNTVGPRSISKPELLSKIKKILENC